MNASAIDTQQAAELLKTMGHPVRLQIMLILDEQPSINVTSLQTQLQLDQTALSHHLIKMKDRGILQSERRNREIYYYLADPTLIELIRLLLDR